MPVYAKKVDVEEQMGANKKSTSTASVAEVNKFSERPEVRSIFSSASFSALRITKSLSVYIAYYKSVQELSPKSKPNPSKSSVLSLSSAVSVC